MVLPRELAKLFLTTYQCKEIGGWYQRIYGQLRALLKSSKNKKLLKYWHASNRPTGISMPVSYWPEVITQCK